jgi:hypothetical protein
MLIVRVMIWDGWSSETMTTEHWYRYDSSFMQEYKVLSTTAQGVWIEVQYYDFFPPKPVGEKPMKKFILRDATKRWACPTKQEALESFVARKKRQIKILKAQIEAIQQSIDHCPTLEKLGAIWEWDDGLLRIAR